MRALGFVVAVVALQANIVHAAPGADAPLGLAAGYKALFTCSATFLANRSSEQITRNELTGIYADYVVPMAKLPSAQIDRRRGWVSVGYDQLMPPRVAFYRKTLGCVLLPPAGGTAVRVMGLDLPAMIDNERDLAWPNGDKTDKVPSGINSRDRLAALLKKAFDGKTYGKNTRTSGVLIASRNGLLAEAYTPDSGMHVPQRRSDATEQRTKKANPIFATTPLLHARGHWTGSTPNEQRAVRIADVVAVACRLEHPISVGACRWLESGGHKIQSH